MSTTGSDEWAGTAEALAEWKEDLTKPLRFFALEMVCIGSDLRKQRELLGDEFPRWCAQACGIPPAEADQLIRFAAARPGWIYPDAVDVTDPAVGELLSLICGRVKPAPSTD
jgi:hypothetical protein